MTLGRDSSALRLNVCKMWIMRNFVVCVLCQNLQLKDCHQLNPSAPGKLKFVYPWSSGDVMVQWTSVDGLAYELYPTCLLLSLTFMGYLCFAKYRMTKLF